MLTEMLGTVDQYLKFRLQILQLQSFYKVCVIIHWLSNWKLNLSRVFLKPSTITPILQGPKSLEISLYYLKLSECYLETSKVLNFWIFIRKVSGIEHLILCLSRVVLSAYSILASVSLSFRKMKLEAKMGLILF